MGSRHHTRRRYGQLEINVAIGDLAGRETPAVIVNLFEGVKRPGGATGAVDRALGGLVSELISAGEITGRFGETTLIHTPSAAYRSFGPSRVLVAGLGKSGDFGLDKVRRVTATSLRRLRSASVGSATSIVHGAGIGGLDAGESAEAIAEGAILGLYRFDKYKSKPPDVSGKSLDSLTIIDIDSANQAALEAGVRRGLAYAGAATAARDMVNEPANMFPPVKMAETALSMAGASGVECEVLEKAELEELGMGAYLGVAAGSDQPPKFIHLRLLGDPGNPSNNLWLIGKGITFDTGGISLKPAFRMGEMKGDMAGGAAVIGAITALASLKPRLNVHAVVAATENMPGGSAQRPGDVVRAMNGKYIEVDNTDAEGRLTLADAISYALSKGAGRIVDVATLTGAASIALGKGQSAVFGNDDGLAAAVIAAGERRGEPMWRLPLDETSKRQNKSKVADIKNTGGRPAGSITAAHFIAEFAGETPWVHVDIAATSMASSANGVNAEGATGVLARSLVQLAEDLGSK